MRLSTTLNPFILPNCEKPEVCRAELENYKNLGFDVLDCIFCNGVDKNSPLAADNWRQWGETLAELSRKIGITYTQCHMPYYNFAAPDGIDTEFDELVRRSITIASMLGARWIVGHPATAWGEANMPKASAKANIAYFSPLVDLGQKLGIGIAIENMADFKDWPGPRAYCATAEELCELTDSFRSEYAGICWDFGHANLMYKDQNPCLRTIGKRLRAVHVHDNHGINDDHLPVFFGTIKWEQLMQTLREIGYTGELSFEVKRIPITLPLEMRNAQWQYVHKCGEYLLSL
ncbi:MAG: sugar phosphate isomerase/epimerase [Treponema sp.]|nr:sugar phosphate isomerase/epimerase [Treponema sp.]